MKRHAGEAHRAHEAPPPTREADTKQQMSRADAHRRLHGLLAEAGLRACRVEHDPAQDVWTVYAIQSTREGAWQDFTLQVGGNELGDARERSTVRRRLVTRLATALSPREAAH